MTFVIISGGIDLSVGALLALASVWSTTLSTQSYGAAMMVFVALLVAASAGLVNGVIIAYGRMAPFIATLLLSRYGAGAVAGYMAAMCAISVAATWFAPETHRREIA